MCKMSSWGVTRDQFPFAFTDSEDSSDDDLYSFEDASQPFFTFFALFMSGFQTSKEVDCRGLSVARSRQRRVLRVFARLDFVKSLQWQSSLGLVC
jgi:hypothetical protein